MAGFELPSLIGGVERAVRARHAGLELETEVDPELPTRWLEGGERLETLLGVLLEHAVCSGGERRARITLRAVGHAGMRRRLRVEVRNLAPYTGRESLSDPHRLSAPQLRRITRALTSEQGMVRSSVEGDLWWCVAALHADEQRIEPLARRPRVLVVDDNAINRQVATHMLTRLGCEVESVDNGAQAVTRSRESAFHLILMDCHMPGMDGYEATQRIRREEGGARHTPIVAWTAHAFEENRRRCLDHGMDGFVAKPAQSDEFQRVVTSWTRPA